MFVVAGRGRRLVAFIERKAHFNIHLKTLTIDVIVQAMQTNIFNWLLFISTTVFMTLTYLQLLGLVLKLISYLYNTILRPSLRALTHWELGP